MSLSQLVYLTFFQTSFCHYVADKKTTNEQLTQPRKYEHINVILLYLRIIH